jgi:7-cyano-7-deazaguanine synthase in queuosine biosynthesis
MECVYVLFSGGLDSFIALKKAQKDFGSDSVRAVYVDVHNRAAAHELYAARSSLPTGITLTAVTNTFDFSCYEREDAFIYGRNAYLLLAASSFIPSSMVRDVRIWLTVQKDEMSEPDRTVEFLRSMQRVIGTLNPDKRVIVETPFSSLDKTDMVSLYFAMDSVTGLSCCVPGAAISLHRL